jgi:hypothetical protein
MRTPRKIRGEGPAEIMATRRDVHRGRRRHRGRNNLLLIIRPSLFVWLLFGAELSAAGDALGRLAGFALLALALACWPGPGIAAQSIAAFRALLLFSLLTTVYLLYLGIGSGPVGPLLWPASALHAGVAIFLGRSLLSTS